MRQHKLRWLLDGNDLCELEVRLRTLNFPVQEIYDGYDKIKNNRNQPKNGTVVEQLEAMFGISRADWTRLKVVYEQSLMGDEYATKLVERINDNDITVSTAYRLLDERDADIELIGTMTKIRLKGLLSHAAAADEFMRLMDAALRHGLPIDQGLMTRAETEDTVRLLRAVGLNTKKVADQLSRALKGR